MPGSEPFPRSIAAANKAIELNDSLSEAHGALGFALFYSEWRVSRAFAEYQRAIQLDARNADAHNWYATSLITVGNNREAMIEIDKAQELDPYRAPFWQIVH